MSRTRTRQLPLWRSFHVALRGLVEALSEQRNLRVHLTAAFLVICAAVWQDVSLMDWLLLTLCIGIVFAVELINTALEITVDLASPEQHELARKAKDVSAAAVLTVSVMAAIIGTAILIFPRLR